MFPIPSIIMLSLGAVLVLACGESGSPPTPEVGPEPVPTEFVSLELPSTGADNSIREPLDTEYFEVLHTVKIQNGRKLVVASTPFNGVQVVEIMGGAAEVVAKLPIEWSAQVLHQVGDWVVLLSRGSDGQGDTSNVMVIDTTDATAPTIAGQVSIPGSLSSNVVIGDELRLTVWRTDQVLHMVPVTLSGEGQPIVGESLSIGRLSREVAHNSTNLAVVRELGMTSPTEGSEIHIFDALGGRGIVTVPGPFVLADFDGSILRVVYKVAGSFPSEQIVQTFDFEDLDNIRPVATATISGEDAVVFVPSGVLYGNKAITIDSEGELGTPMSSSLVWQYGNWRLVGNDTRFLTVESTNTQDSRNLVVRLYDIEDVSQTVQVDVVHVAGLGKSLGQGFLVREGVVSVLAEDGLTEETGLILVPFAESIGRNAEHGALKILTFSASTVTSRGVISSYANANLEVVGLDGNIALLNGGEITVHDLSDFSFPQEISRVEFGPTITDIVEFGEYVVRRHADFNYNHKAMGRLSDRMEVVSSGDVFGSALTTFEIPRGAKLRKVGDSLVAIMHVRMTSDAGTTTFDVWDLSNPLAPVSAPSLVTQDLLLFDDNFEIEKDSYGYGPALDTYVLDDALVFPEETVTFISRSQRWVTVKLHLLDVSDPAQPKFGPVVDLADKRVFAMTPHGRMLHVTTWEPFQIADDDAEYRRNTLHTVDYSDLTSPSVGDPIHIPGRVLNIEGDEIVTVDGVSGADGRTEPIIYRLRITNGAAVVEDSFQYSGRDAHDVRFMGGHVLISHSPRSEYDLSLDIVTLPGLDVASTTAIDGDWTMAVGVTDRHIVYEKSGVFGTVAIDIANSTSPAVYFDRWSAWGRKMTRLGDDLHIAAGRRGITTLGATQ